MGSTFAFFLLKKGYDIQFVVHKPEKIQVCEILQSFFFPVDYCNLLDHEPPQKRLDLQAI